jgi:GntR family transcriptional regulator
MFAVRIQPGQAAPLYKQIIDQVSLAVANGSLAPGEDVPSVRALAEQLVINPNTVAKAYGELVREGLLESMHGKGFFVAKRRQVHAKAEKDRRLDQAVDHLINEAALLGCDHDDVRTALERKLSERLGPHRRGK